MTRTILLCLAASLAFLSCNENTGQKDDSAAGNDSLAAVHNRNVFRQKLDSIIKEYKATIGVAILGIEDRDTITVNDKYHYPMQSVYKFPLAMAVLDRVDKGKLSLTQKVHIGKKYLHEHTWSPLRDKYPKGNVDVTLADLLDYTVAQSDNNTCDILFEMMTGPLAVDTYIHQLNISDMAIVATEHEMHDGWNIQYANYSTPSAMRNLLDLFYSKKHLSDSGTNFLMKVMTESSNSRNRIKGMLPEETPVAHKTGTSNTNDRGMTAATNDAGIITLPNGKHFAIAVFVSDTYEQHETNEAIIARIAKATYDYFMAKEH